MLAAVVCCWLVQMHDGAWRAAGVADRSLRFPPLERLLAEYQTPEKVDSIERMKGLLASTEETLVRCGADHMHTFAHTHTCTHASAHTVTPKCTPTATVTCQLTCTRAQSHSPVHVLSHTHEHSPSPCHCPCT